MKGRTWWGLWTYIVCCNIMRGSIYKIGWKLSALDRHCKLIWANLKMTSSNGMLCRMLNQWMLNQWKRYFACPFRGRLFQAFYAHNRQSLKNQHPHYQGLNRGGIPGSNPEIFTPFTIWYGSIILIHRDSLNLWCVHLHVFFSTKPQNRYNY